MSVRSVFPRRTVIQQSATPADRTSRRSSSVVRARACVRACGRARACACAKMALPKRFPVARGDSASKLVTGPLGRSGPATGPLPWSRQWPAPSSRPKSLSRGVPASLGGRTRFRGGAGYISSASYARREQLVATDGELRRPTFSWCTDGDVTTAPIPRVPKSPFRLAASRPIRTCRIPGERSAAATATCPALGPSA